MATTQTNKAHGAHYHPIKVTKAWAAFVAAMGDEATATAAKRLRRQRERKAETTYARGELGGS